MRKVSEELTKNYILKNISQIKIFATYFNISVELIQYCIDSGEKIKSPIRDDKHPSMGFKYDNKNKLKCKDFAGYFWGDCFDAVALIISNIYNKEIVVNNKQHFIIILKHITITFKDIFYGLEKDITITESIKLSINNIKNTKPIIELVTREWNDGDKLYFKNIGIDLQILNILFIYPVDQYYINRKINPQPKYYFDPKDPCYGYYLGTDRNSIASIQLYFPNRSKNDTRFITNCNHLHGIFNLNRNDYHIIVVTKSTKDRAAIYSHLINMKSKYKEINNIIIGVINIPYETYRLRDVEHSWLKNKLTEDGILISLMDNDETGLAESIYLNNTFNIYPLLIPKKYNCKDFSQLRYTHGFDIVSQLILKTLIIIKHVRYKRSNYTYNTNRRTNSDLPF